jgi:hypothetical protein
MNQDVPQHWLDRPWVAAADWPNHDDYAKRTTRVIPVVVLERAG